MNDLVIGGDGRIGMGCDIVTEWLRQHPDVAAKLRERNVRVVVVEPKNDHGQLFENTQAAIDEAIVPDGAQALFVAVTYMRAILDTGAFEFGPRGRPLVKMRGRFVGYIAFGEGGVAFFDETDTPKLRGPDPADVLALL
jgi:hypothetical protein